MEYRRIIMPELFNDLRKIYQTFSKNRSRIDRNNTAAFVDSDFPYTKLFEYILGTFYICAITRLCITYPIFCLRVW